MGVWGQLGGDTQGMEGTEAQGMFWLLLLLPDRPCGFFSHLSLYLSPPPQADPGRHQPPRPRKARHDLICPHLEKEKRNMRKTGSCAWGEN